MRILCFLLILACSTTFASEPSNGREVVVDKASRTLWLVENHKVLESFPISLGDSPIGHKVQVGDERTPEGTYLLTAKMSSSKFYKSIHINYPNERDIRRAKELGVHPGGNIKIHGLPNNSPFDAAIYKGLDWTDGCIAVSNEDMDKIWMFVRPNTPIHINGAKMLSSK